MAGLALLVALGIMLGAESTDAITVVLASIGVVFAVSMSVAIAGIGVRRLHDRGKTVLLGVRRRGAAAKRLTRSHAQFCVTSWPWPAQTCSGLLGRLLVWLPLACEFLGFSDLGRGHMLCGNLSVV
jgi:uncharacterized membrane protein YhaH (DUF805 family)